MRRGIVASAKKNSTTIASRGSGTPADNGVATWATKTNAVDGAVGTNPNTYATWTNSTSSGVGYIEVSGYAFSSIPAGSTILDVKVVIRHLCSNTGRITSTVFQAFDGATSVSGSQGTTLSTAAHDETMNFVCTLAQIKSATFKIRVTTTHAANTQSLVFSLDHADVTVSYAPP